MDTEVIQTDPQAGYAEACGKAVEVLMRGGLVSFPTETVYGVAARADHAEAVGRLRRIKSRGPGKAFTVHIGSPDAADGFAPDLPSLAKRFILKAWPGPLTLVVGVEDPATAPAMAGLNGSAAATAYFEKAVGLRCPDDPVAGAVLRAVQAPVVAASANLAGSPPPFAGEDVLEGLDGKIDLLIDNGRTKYTKPSTIVRVTGRSYELVREGVYDAGIVRRLSTLRILFVCTGNTCRSPMAAGLARKMIAQRRQCEVSKLADLCVLVESAGTFGGGGGVSPHASTVMSRRGIDLADHVSSALSEERIRQADFIFTMTEAHLGAVSRLVPSAGNRAALLLEGRDVADPIGGSEEDYERCAQLIEKGVSARIQEVNP